MNYCFVPKFVISPFCIILEFNLLSAVLIRHLRCGNKYQFMIYISWTD